MEEVKKNCHLENLKQYKTRGNLYGDISVVNADSMD